MTVKNRPIPVRVKWLFRIGAALFGALGLIIVVYLAALFISHDGNADFLKIDSCLDSGGQWNYEAGMCEH
jgi:hypothetical protein